MPETALFAVAGDPVLHSLSPMIFRKLFRAAGRDAVYFRLAAENAHEVLKAAEAMGLSGVNITSPFKEGVLPYLIDMDEPSRVIGAVNGIVARPGGFAGFNTDPDGVIGALRGAGFVPAGRRAIVLGAGGAARAAAYGLIGAGASEVILINRTVARAASAARRLGCRYGSLENSGRRIGLCDICVSCVPGGAEPGAGAVMKKGSAFLAAAYRRSVRPRRGPDGTRTMIDGREWLWNQALPSYRRFTGNEAPRALQRPAAWKDLDRAPGPKANIALVGFPGAGKTTVGRSLAGALGFDFVDIDAHIERRTGLSIPAIFAARGESGFRDIEGAVIHDTVPEARKVVFSIGGGGLGRADNRSLIERRCLVVWLWASLRVSLGRMAPGTRPLLQNARARAEELFAARQPVYARSADIAVVGEGKPVGRIIGRIRNEIDQAFAD